MPWLDSFYAKNANLVWARLKARQQRYTAHDKANLVRQLLELKYPVGSDPTIFRRRFAALVKNLRNAEITLHEDILMSVWFSALPKELSVLKQALGAKENLKWTDIYDTLIQEYSSRGATKSRDRSEKPYRDQKELAAAAQERKQRRDTKRQRPQFGSKPDKGCQHCGKPGHNEDKCWKKYPNLRRDKKPKPSQSNNDSETEYGMPFMDSTILDQLLQDIKTESSIPPNEHALFTPVSDNMSSSYFIFDSAATTHVTPSRRLLTEITNVPEVSMGTAIRGQGTVIRQRGEIRLDKKHVLKEVAYVSNASANLISEGRLCDAGFEIQKDKNSIYVYKRIKSEGKEDVIKTILTGYRWNRLWIYSTKDGNKLVDSSLPELEEDSESDDAQVKKLKRKRKRLTKSSKQKEDE